MIRLKYKNIELFEFDELDNFEKEQALEYMRNYIFFSTDLNYEEIVKSTYTDFLIQKKPLFNKNGEFIINRGDL